MFVSNCSKDGLMTFNILTHFQPIISIKRRAIIGLEALSRGVSNAGSDLIPPIQLFEFASKNGHQIMLDRLCREKALASFKQTDNKKKLMLYLNFDASIIDKGVLGSGHLINFVNKLNLNPNNIVIEIIESNVNDIEALKKFIKTYKSFGFLIALDDIGTGHSNLDRISLIEPDILKIDKSLIRDIDIKYHNQEIVNSLVNLSRKIGALVVAEGIENEKEAIAASELGVDFLQGFYFLEPQIITDQSLQSTSIKINDVAKHFKVHMLHKFDEKLNKEKKYYNLADSIIKKLAKTEDFDSTLAEIINLNHFIECIYVLNERGIQVTRTVCDLKKLSNYKNPLFKPAEKGTDHSLKEYYLSNRNSQRIYFSEPYISLATGNLCLTISAVFNRHLKDEKYILCLDINEDYLV
ncbi:MAG: EAL domain-containing protein [Firmicutes bacterium]|nr:EAL domain-containing protein [Bacillota bacterium]